MLRPSTLALAIATIAFVSIGCAPSDPDGAPTPISTAEPTAEAISWTPETAAERGPFAVGIVTRTMVDSSRPTKANRDYPGAPDRTLNVDVWYPAAGDLAADELPDADLDPAGAPYPLIVFSHGLSSSRRQSVSYTQHLASHGYVVVAPDYPLTNGGSPGGANFADVVNQPGDVSFVIDTMLGYSNDPADTLLAAIDGEAIGITGHSLGGLTSVLTVFGESRDSRVDAALPFSTPGCFLAGGLVSDESVPILAVGGTRDLITPPAAARRPYDIANAPRYYVELTGASHVRFADFDIDDEDVLGPLATILGDEGTGPALGGEIGECLAAEASDSDPPLTLARQGELLRIFATPFFDAYLRGNEDARAFLDGKLADLVPEARVEIDLGSD